MNSNSFNRSRVDKMLQIAGTISLVFFLLALSGCDDRPQKVQQGMKAYLQDRYGIEFVVGQPYVTGSMDTAHYQSKAHPKGQPEIKFNVDEMSRLDEAGKEYKPEYYRDYYLEAKWDYQGEQAIEKKMREIYGASVDMKVSYRFSGGRFEQMNWDFDKVFKANPNSIISLNIEIFMDGSKFNNETEAAKAYAILKAFILDNKSKEYFFDVIFLDKADKQDYLANSDLYVKKTILKYHPKTSYSNKYKKEINAKRVLGCFRMGSSSEKPVKINSVSDLMKYFRS
jgi:hypothetical protein